MQSESRSPTWIGRLISIPRSSRSRVSDTEVAGESYEHLEGVFGLRMRVVRMRLGDEFIELTEYLAPKGRPIPLDSRSNDRWFQQLDIIFSDSEKTYASV